MQSTQNFRLSYAALLLLVFVGCKQKAVADTERELVAQAFGRFLYADQLQGMVPQNISPSDSLKLVGQYAEQWAQDEALVQEAENHFGADTEI